MDRHLTPLPSLSSNPQAHPKMHSKMTMQEQNAASICTAHLKVRPESWLKLNTQIQIHKYTTGQSQVSMVLNVCAACAEVKCMTL